MNELAVNDKIKLVVDDENKLLLRGDKNSSTTCVAIEAFFKYDNQIYKKYIPFYFGSYYQNMECWIEIEEEIVLKFEDLNYAEDIRKNIIDFYNISDPIIVKKWINKQKSKLRGKNDKTSKFLRKLLNNPDKGVTYKNSYQSQGLVRSLRQKGYCILTYLENGTTYNMLIPGFMMEGKESETISPEARKRILKYYNYTDALSGNKYQKYDLIVEHKFPEVRWGNKKAENNDNLTDEQIKEKFQVFTKQNNLIKESACKKCRKYRIRQYPLNINFFYEGTEEWELEIEDGIEAELGCEGCGWYDTIKWKNALQKILEKGVENNE